MQTVTLTPADQAAIDKKLTYMEAKDMAMWLSFSVLIARTSNKVVEACFRQCTKNFRSKELDKKERECVGHCANKYMDMTNRIYRIYQEVQTAPSTPSPQ